MKPVLHSGFQFKGFRVIERLQAFQDGNSSNICNPTANHQAPPPLLYLPPGVVDFLGGEATEEKSSLFAEGKLSSSCCTPPGFRPKRGVRQGHGIANL